MKVIVVGALKGGVGKSTLTTALAVEAERQGLKVAIADLDPLQCVARWYDARSQGDPTTTPHLIENVSSPKEAVARARRRRDDWLVIDTSPALIGPLRAALDVADVFVTPIQPSPLDVQTMDPVIEVSDAIADRRVVVLSRTPRDPEMTRGARSYLKARKIAVWDGEMRYRLVHPIAMLSGRTAQETDPEGDVATEIHALWTQVDKLCRKTKRKRRPRTENVRAAR